MRPYRHSFLESFRIMHLHLPRGRVQEAGHFDADVKLAEKLPENSSLVVQPSNIKGAGNGLFSKAEFQKGEIVCEYEGTLCTVDQLLHGNTDTSYIFTLDSKVSINAKNHVHSFGRYVNDNGDPESINAKFEALPKKQKAVIRAKRNISIGEEIYASYGNIYWIKQGFLPGRTPEAKERKNTNLGISKSKKYQLENLRYATIGGISAVVLSFVLAML
mmetsp:Transcript_11352/g.13517  ORF Transcript_11352/g.13517 Transcript_11352/m.13517 type:complete len:217 (+) Transcript_11352:70-720(+)